MAPTNFVNSSPDASRPFRKIQVIINPAAGAEHPILGILNKAFGATATQWDVSITHKEGDAQRLAQEAILAGCDVVAVNGGDGTLMEVACALQNTGIPLAIFPGGTGNAMAGELGIPADLLMAVDLVATGEYDLQTVDLGMANGKVFVLRAAIGFEADMIKGADRELKNRFGILAYAFSAINELRTLEQIRYRLSVDGQSFEAEGISCMIANSANFALGGLRLSHTIDVSDGLLDLIIFDNVTLGTLLSVTSTVLTGGDSTENPTLHHWQGREIIVDCETPQTVSIDGEFIAELPVKAHVLPGALKIVVPKSEPPIITAQGWAEE